MLPAVMRRQRFWFWVFAPTVGLVQCWSYRFWIEPDGVNYLDVADAYLRHDWSTAINSYWSPLYSWLLALALHATQLSGYWESTILHLLNLVIFLFALRCGEFFISELLRSRTERSIPDWGLWTVGYCILLFVSLFMNAAYIDTPDLLTSSFVYIAAALLLRIHSGRATPRIFLIFGGILGIAYLSKTVMFPIAFVFLAVAGIRRGTVLAFACFAAVSLPWIVILSRSVGHITYSDAGPAAYVEFVGHCGTPIHPPRILFSSPQVREFAEPVRATYPPWYNAPYWTAGLRPCLHLKQQLAVLARSARNYLHILSGQKEFIAGFLLLLIAQPKLTPVHSRLLLPPLFGLCLYAPIWVEGRYVGAFFFLIWLVLYSGLHVRSGRLLKFVMLAIAVVTVFKIARAELERPHDSANVQWQIAQAIRKQGIESGMRVAVFGHSNAGDYWAHLLGVRVVADIQADAMPAFWSAPHELQDDILSRLSKFDVRAVVTPDSKDDDWQDVPGTSFGIKILKETLKSR